VPGLTRIETLTFQNELVTGTAAYLALSRALVRVDYVLTR
jgi:hypothetical protein